MVYNSEFKSEEYRVKQMIRYYNYLTKQVCPIEREVIEARIVRLEKAIGFVPMNPMDLEV